MTRLEELIYALATVIVRYHDSQDNIESKDKLVTAIDPTTRRKKSHERAVEIIQDTKINFVPYLEGRINACTGGYQARKEFLSFILNVIRYLKEQLDRKTPHASTELQKFQEKLNQLFIDFRQLLNIKKGFRHPVTFSFSKSSKIHELSGLVNDRYVGGKYCNSGQLLIDEVLFVLHMTTEDTNDELKDMAASICSEQQIFLEYQSEKLKKVTEESEKDDLKLELGTQKSKLESQQLGLDNQKLKMEAQQLELDNQKLKIETQQLELDNQKLKIEAQQLELDNQKLKIETQQLELEKLKTLDKQKSELESQVLELTEKNKGQLDIIEQLTKELEKTKAELQKAQSETPIRRYPYSPLFGGLGGLPVRQRIVNSRFFPLQPNGHTTAPSHTLPTAEDFEESYSKLTTE